MLNIYLTTTGEFKFKDLAKRHHHGLLLFLECHQVNRLKLSSND